MAINSWTPFYNLWLRLFAAKDDAPYEVKVTKTKGHMTLTRAGANPQLLWERYGNTQADKAAKQVMEDIPDARLHFKRVQRTSAVADTVLRYFGRLLAWSSERQLLPTAERGVSRLPRLRSSPHALCESPCGRIRCVK